MTAPAATAPKVTPRLIDTSASDRPPEDPAKWTLDEFGADVTKPGGPAPSPKPAPVRVPTALPSKPGAPPLAGRSAPTPLATPTARSGLAAFPSGPKSDRGGAPKPPPSSPGARPAPIASLKEKEPLAAALAASAEELSPGKKTPTAPAATASRPPITQLQDDDDEVEPTRAGQVPEDILELSRAQRLPSKPPPARVEPAVTKESPKPAAVEPVRRVTPPALRKAVEPLALPPVPPAAEEPDADDGARTIQASSPDAMTLVTPPRFEEEAPAPVAVEPPPPPSPPVEVLPPTPPVKEAPPPKEVSAKETPAFSSGDVTDQPSKFALDSRKPKAKKKSSVGLLVFTVLAVAACAGVYVYTRHPEILGIKPAPGPTPPTTAAPTSKPTAGTTAAVTATATEAATASVAPPTTASAEASVDAPPKDSKTLAPTEGYVFVKSSLEGEVYVGLHKLGPVNSWVVSSCLGAQYLRLGKPKGAGVEWTSEGKPSPVACQGQTKVEITQAALPAPVPLAPVPAPGPAPGPAPPPPAPPPPNPL